MYHNISHFSKISNTLTSYFCCQFYFVWCDLNVHLVYLPLLIFLFCWQYKLSDTNRHKVCLDLNTACTVSPNLLTRNNFEILQGLVKGKQKNNPLSPIGFGLWACQYIYTLTTEWLYKKSFYNDLDVANQLHEHLYSLK